MIKTIFPDPTQSNTRIAVKNVRSAHRKSALNKSLSWGREICAFFGAILLVSICTMAASSWVSAATIYSTSGNGTGMATIDSVTGASSVVGATGTIGTWALAFDIDGTIYTVIDGFNSSPRLATLNPTTGQATAVGSTALPTTIIALEIGNDGTLYGASFSGALYAIDKSTGAATLIGPLGAGLVNTMDLAFDSAGTLWATVGNRLWTIDTATGAATFRSAISGVSGEIMGIMFDEDDTLFATSYTSTGPLYRIDAATGIATLVALSGLFFPHGGDVFISATDSDNDGVPDDQDNCPDIANADQADSDNDGIGDVCEPDSDADGVIDDVDNCVNTLNPDQQDTDGDGQGNACDADDDGDGVNDDTDNCSLIPNADQADFDNDGQGDACDADVDGDGVNDAADLCLGTASGDVTDTDGCSIPQICPCENPSGWKNHGEYVKCVARTSEDFLDLGLITEAQKDAIVSAAGSSQCGQKE